MQAAGQQWTLEARFTHDFDFQAHADKERAEATASLCAQWNRLYYEITTKGGRAGKDKQTPAAAEMAGPS